jgi:hypothetical protein
MRISYPFRRDFDLFVTQYQALENHKEVNQLLLEM